MSILFRRALLGTGLALLLGKVFIPKSLMDPAILRITEVHAKPGGVGVDGVLAALHVFNIASRFPFVNLFQNFLTFQPDQKPW